MLYTQQYCSTHHAVHGSLGHDRCDPWNGTQDGHDVGGVGMEQSYVLLVVVLWDLGNDVRKSRLDERVRTQNLGGQSS